MAEVVMMMGRIRTCPACNKASATDAPDLRA